MLAIVGPTTAGKTELSLHLASLFDGEIISADSRLIYRGLDIGTAKPSITERLRVAHHLIDICPPDQTLTLGQYLKLAYAIADDVHDRNRLSLLVGGTGQYIYAFTEGWQVPDVAPDTLLRTTLETMGEQELSRWLKEIDPKAAQNIDSRNIRRVVRALEVAMLSGRPISQLQTKRSPAYLINMIGLTCSREILYKRIDDRVDHMMSAGFLEEVEHLLNQGFDHYLPSMSGLGYRQLCAYLRGECTLEEAIVRIKFETHRYARQQNTWFKTDDPTIKWFDVLHDNWVRDVEYFVESWLSGN